MKTHIKRDRQSVMYCGRTVAQVEGAKNDEDFHRKLRRLKSLVFEGVQWCERCKKTLKAEELKKNAQKAQV